MKGHANHMSWGEGREGKGEGREGKGRGDRRRKSEVKKGEKDQEKREE